VTYRSIYLAAVPQTVTHVQAAQLIFTVIINIAIVITSNVIYSKNRPSCRIKVKIVQFKTAKAELKDVSLNIFY